MSHRELLEYVRKAKECGASHADISARLCGAGWYKVDVQDALEFYDKIVPRSLEPQLAVTRRPAQKARSYDPYLVAIAALSFVAGFLGFIWLTHY